ncbi:MAG: AEC family transporter [Acholeplasmataceae bacterium]|jgi:predicted permease|nr:AEC family transporter [Acholeplasmataceae bacterium]
MAATFLFAMNAILPIVLLIALGVFLRKIHLIDQHFNNVLIKYVFRVGLPVLLFYNVYQIESFDEINWDIVIYTTIATLLIFAIGIVIVKIFTKDDRQKGVVLQTAFRSNYALTGIPLAEAIGGAAALKVVSLLAAFAIPLANVLSVIALTMFQKNEFGERISIKKMIQNIISNPLIIAVFSGLFVLFLRSLLPTTIDGQPIFTLKNQLPFSVNFMKMISQTASPMALIALGGQFEISVVKPLLKQITLGVSLRILIVPALTIFFAYLLQDRFTGLRESYPALIALYGSPVAVSSAIMTQEMGGDEKLASQLVVWTTTFSMFTIFITIVILRSAGLI